MSDRQQSIDLLNSTHQFPGPVVIKVIGTNHVTFVASVVITVRERIAAVVDPPFSTRETPNGRHVAVTLQPLVLDAEQVLDIYDSLRQLEGVLMLM